MGVFDQSTFKKSRKIVSQTIGSKGLSVYVTANPENIMKGKEVNVIIDIASPTPPNRFCEPYWIINYDFGDGTTTSYESSRQGHKVKKSYKTLGTKVITVTVEERWKCAWGGDLYRDIASDSTTVFVSRTGIPIWPLR